MKFSPRNRHLLVEKIETPKEEKTSTILLPEDCNPQLPVYSYVKVLDTSPDCTIDISKGDAALVETRMLNEIEIEGETSNLILENYVLGVISSH